LGAQGVRRERATVGASEDTMGVAKQVAKGAAERKKLQVAREDASGGKDAIVEATGERTVVVLSIVAWTLALR